MSTDVYQLVGTIVIVIGSIAVAWRSSRKTAPEGRSASAAEVEALGTRLDAQAGRIDQLERVNRALYAYIATDHAEHRRHGWDVTPLPEEIA